MSVADDRSSSLAPPTPAPADEPADAEPPERLTLILVEEDGDWSGFGPLQDAVGAVAAALGHHRRLRTAAVGEASVVLASDALVRKLNRAHRGKDAPTNVLSFPYQRPPGAADDADGYLGDIVLAAETVRREAAERGMEPSHHLQHLVVHGVLHLLGYDHESDLSAAEMEGLETDVLAAIGVADPYAASAVS
jgi:probable rRNA maturation factor